MSWNEPGFTLAMNWLAVFNPDRGGTPLCPAPTPGTEGRGDRVGDSAHSPTAPPRSAPAAAQCAASEHTPVPCPFMLRFLRSLPTSSVIVSTV